METSLRVLHAQKTPLPSVWAGTPIAPRLRPRQRVAWRQPAFEGEKSNIVVSRCSNDQELDVNGQGLARSGEIACTGTNSSQLVVAVDVDEVLGRFVESLNAYLHNTHNLSYDVSDYFVYDFAKVWNVSQDESNHHVHDFFESSHFRDGIAVIPGAWESLKRMNAMDNISFNVVTSRQDVIQEHTLEWIDRHFEGVFSAVHFGNHFALEGTSRKKSEICTEINARLLIDDNPSYALECAEAGIQVLLFDWKGSYAWSKDESLLVDGHPGPHHPNIKRVRSWEEVESAVSGLLRKTNALVH
jgi:uncharacterized HAD superfamily protein